MTESIKDKIIREYIEKYRENSTKIDYYKLGAEDGLTTYFYDELPQTEINGYPIASDFVSPDGKTVTVLDYQNLTKEEQKSCRLRYYYLPKNHEIYIGTTGCGKTTGCVEPQIRAISSQKNKPCLFVSDPKGELFDHNAEHLKKQGYKLFVLNFKDIENSDMWNPLLDLYDLKMRINKIGTDYEQIEGDIPENCKLIGSKSDYDKSTVHYKYENKVFSTKELFKNYINYRKSLLESDLDSLVNQFASMMIEVQSKTDKSWEYGAQNLLKGLIFCMLDDASDPTARFNRSHMNFKTLADYYNKIKTPILSGRVDLRDMPFMHKKSEKAKRLMSTALNNAQNTMKSYCGVFDDSVKDWFQGHIFALTFGNTIDISNENDEPFAIFLITRDYEKSDFTIAGLFVDWLYRRILEGYENNTFKRELHFMLDEFGNIPKIKDFENKVSTSRSRNIWFHLVLQSFSQLINVYGDQVSQIILDNCSQIFMGSTNSATKELFSKSCGNCTIPTLQSVLYPTDNTLVSEPLIPVSTLNFIKPGQIYTLRYGFPVIMSQYVRSYIVAEQGTFADRLHANGLKTCLPSHEEIRSSGIYEYKRVTTTFDTEFID